MTSVTTILTMLAMLWHAMVGCCAHHVHEEASHSHADSCQAVLVHHHGCDHHSHAVDAEHEHASHADHAEDHSHGVCDRAECLFVMPDSVGHSSSLSKAIGCQPYFDTACFAPLTIHPLELSVRPGRQTSRDLHAHLGSRLHLELSIWLI